MGCLERLLGSGRPPRLAIPLRGWLPAAWLGPLTGVAGLAWIGRPGRLGRLDGWDGWGAEAGCRPDGAVPDLDGCGAKKSCRAGSMRAA